MTMEGKATVVEQPSIHTPKAQLYVLLVYAGKGWTINDSSVKRSDLTHRQGWYYRANPTCIIKIEIPAMTIGEKK